MSYLILTDKEDLITQLKISGFLGANDCNLISLQYAKGIKDIPKDINLVFEAGQFNKGKNSYETNKLGDETQLEKTKELLQTV